MSYPLDITEQTERRLENELERRREARAAGTCDYCGRLPNTPACQFPDRHHDHRIEGMVPWCSTHAEPMRGVRGSGRWVCSAYYDDPDVQEGSCLLTSHYSGG